MQALLSILTWLLATAFWFVAGRLVLSLFIRNPRNPVWQLFLIVTDPVYRVSRSLTAGHVSVRGLGLVSLVWLLLARFLAIPLLAGLLDIPLRP